MPTDMRNDLHILLIEDNSSITKGLEYSFNQTGYKITTLSHIKDACDYLARQTPDLIILDISLPDGNGLELYENTIEKKSISTIFLTAKDDEETIVKGLTLGAEDYITKPFSTKELLVRIEKIMRRKNKNNILKVKDISFDMDKMEVYKDDHQIELTSLELKILHYLFENLNKVVRRGTIIEKVWEWTGNDIEDNTVTVYLKRIREKLNSDIILTIKGIGYRIDADEK